MSRSAALAAFTDGNVGRRGKVPKGEDCLAHVSVGHALASAVVVGNLPGRCKDTAFDCARNKAEFRTTGQTQRISVEQYPRPGLHVQREFPAGEVFLPPSV